MARRFDDRHSAGEQLADELERLELADPIVLALPRGGVPVADPVASRLGAPLDILTVRKIGLPGHAELAMGAVASGGTTVRNPEVIDGLGVDPTTFADAADRARAELQQREQRLRGDRRRHDITGRDVVIVDDGIATGSTMKAAIDAIQSSDPGSITVAVPVAAPEVVADIRRHVDRVICLLQPSRLRAVGLWYRRFGQTPDEEVRRLLDHS